jgi:hypothetical protein
VQDYWITLEYNFSILNLHLNGKDAPAETQDCLEAL